MTDRIEARRLFSSCGLALTFAAASAAQETAAPATSPEPIEQIVVTAERRESTVQETPIAVSAFDAEALRQQGILDPSDLHSHVPGFFYTEGGGGSPITQIAVRGVGNENVTAGGDPGVAYHFDGVYLGRPTAAATDFFDLERVEVLRGPQGTLYGRNATGGSINVVSKKPTEEWDAIADATYGNYDAVRVRAAGGGPLTDWLGFRVAAVRDRHDGYLRNVAGSAACGGECEDTDEEDVWGVRLHVLAEPTESTDVSFTLQYHWDDGAVGQVRLDPFTLSPLPPTSDIRRVRNDLETQLDMEARLFTLRVDQDLEAFGGLRLSAFISRQEQEWTQQVDNDFSELPSTFTGWTEPSDQWVGEIQLASANDSALEWLFGFFALREDVAMRFLFYDVNPAVFSFRFQNGGDFTTHSYAVFGEGALELEPFTLRLGLRWTSDNKEGSDFLSVTFPYALGDPIAPFDSESIDETWHRLTGRLVAEYRPSEDAMLYASVSRGYKSGGLLIGNRNPVVGGANRYDPEEIWAYELGAKTRWLGDRLQANVAGFFSDYDDLQVFILTGAAAHIENAAKAKIGGIELELLTVPIENLQLNASAAWIHAEYDEYTSADPVAQIPGLGGSSETNQKGNPLNRLPRWVANIGAQYAIPFFAGSTLTPRVDWHYQSEVFFRPYELDRDRSPAWDRWEARILWEAAPTDYGQFSVELFMKNIEDNDHVMNISVGAISELFPAQGILHPPRTYGFTLGWRY
ncbi:MAG TPA: TonB-dependent receptor, partial [Myxococcota bacterium]|nr:TonB-dependent receptor [Myxococcota bacterium]